MILAYVRRMCFLINMHMFMFSSKLNEEFLRRPLCTISDDVFEIGETIERLPQPMIECLRTVSDCKEYIFWLRKEVKGECFVMFSLTFKLLLTDLPTDRSISLFTILFLCFIRQRRSENPCRSCDDVCWRE